MRRNLAGVYIFERFEGETKPQPTCFEDCTEATQDKWLKSLERDRLINLSKHLAKTLRNIGDDKPKKALHKLMTITEADVLIFDLCRYCSIDLDCINIYFNRSGGCWCKYNVLLGTEFIQLDFAINDLYPCCILHELAHILTLREFYVTKGVKPHGIEFCENFDILLDYYINK